MQTNYPHRSANAPLRGDTPPAKTAGKARIAPPAEQALEGERSPIKALDAILTSMRTSLVHVDNPGLVLQRLIDAGFGNLPLPGSGRTLVRWQALAAVAAFDLSLAKLFEGHADALAIHAELGVGVPADGSTWGVWCAESSDARLNFFKTEQLERTCVLDGRKVWCSGAQALTYALVSAWNEDGEQCLAAVPLNQSGITVIEEGWHAVGMQRSASVDVVFDGVVGVPVGMPGAYASRPGFWHGSAGIAACWYGATVEIARRLHQAMIGEADAHGKAHLGAVDVALCSAAAVLRETAAFIDANPAADAMRMAFRARLGVENAAMTVIEHATRALGAGPLCRDAHFARMVADLPVFLRQSHAERDLQKLGESLAETQPAPSEKPGQGTATEVRTELWKL